MASIQSCATISNMQLPILNVYMLRIHEIAVEWPNEEGINNV